MTAQPKPKWEVQSKSKTAEWIRFNIIEEVLIITEA
jgi:hypothetical protein